MPKKRKLKLDELNVKSFTTDQTSKGGEEITSPTYGSFCELTKTIVSRLEYCATDWNRETCNATGGGCGFCG